jgi:hypothetical protein
LTRSKLVQGSAVVQFSGSDSYRPPSAPQRYHRGAGARFLHSICIIPIFVVTAVLFANEKAATGLDISDFGIVAMAKIRPPLITEAIYISDPSPCIQVRRPGFEVLQSRDYQS